MKYLIVINPVTQCPSPVMFQEDLAHSQVAGELEVVSAGFCDQLGNVWGGSDGLGIQSHPADAAMVKVGMSLRVVPKL